jgi:choline transport protein
MASHKSAEAHAREDGGIHNDRSQDYSMIEKNATTADAHDMQRMGKTQEMRRNFRSITILGFCVVILSTWENILNSSVFALGNGGTAGLIWGYFIVMVGFGFVVASLAEMASM